MDGGVRMLGETRYLPMSLVHCGGAGQGSRPGSNWTFMSPPRHRGFFVRANRDRLDGGTVFGISGRDKLKPLEGRDGQAQMEG
jgi:hypothetical protein